MRVNCKVGIDLKDVGIGNRYLCSLPDDSGVDDYIVMEISSVNFQKNQYIKLRHEQVSRWMLLSTFLCSVLEKLEEDNNVNDTYLECLSIKAEGLKSETR